MSFYKIYLFIWSYILSSHVLFAATIPKIDCGELPGCTKSEAPAGGYEIIGNIIATGIKYVAVLAVIAVMVGGIMMLISSGDEEKTKKAKNVVIWALVGVLVSVFAWSMIGIVNNFTI